MEQQIRFCTTNDGVRIAYSTVGTGTPLVKAANWLSHLEYDWRSPAWRHWLESLAAGNCLVRYDERGCGLSDWDVSDFTFEAWIRDLEAVVDTLGFDRFPLLGISQGGPVAIAYTVRHPEKVNHLILYGSYARGWAKRDQTHRKENEALLTLTQQGWGKDNPAYRQIFTCSFRVSTRRTAIHSAFEVSKYGRSQKRVSQERRTWIDCFGISPNSY